MKVRKILGNLPLIGRFIYPLKNRYSIFKPEGSLYSYGLLKDLSEFRYPKIVVFGLPKSGNVWLQNLLAECLDMNKIHISRNRRQSGVAMTHQKFGGPLIYRHDLARGVYLMRDIRDIVVSYYHYSKTEEYHQTTTDPFCHFDDIESFYFEYFLHVLVPRYDWYKHAETYIAHGLPMVKYRDLWDNPVEELSRTFDRLGLKVEKAKIEKVVSDNEINKLSKTGKTTHTHIPKTHFRKGGYGNYKGELPENVLRDINQRFGAYLQKWGYEADHFDQPQ